MLIQTKIEIHAYQRKFLKYIYDNHFILVYNFLFIYKNKVKHLFHLCENKLYLINLWQEAVIQYE